MGMESLSRSDRLALVFFFATACLGFLAWAFPNMTRWFTIPGASVSFCLAVYFAWPELTRFVRWAIKHKAASAAACIVMLIVAGVAIGPMSNSLATKPEMPIAHNSNIALDCESEVYPTLVKADKPFNVLSLFPLPTERGGRGVFAYANNSGQTWKWFPGTITDMSILEGYKCVVTNYGDVPIFDYSMNLELDFFEAVAVDSQSPNRKRGAIILKREWPIEVQKIDVGLNNSYEFHIYNDNKDKFVYVTLPATALGRRLGEAEVKTVTLTEPAMGVKVPLFFSPRFQ